MLGKRARPFLQNSSQLLLSAGQELRQDCSKKNSTLRPRNYCADASFKNVAAASGTLLQHNSIDFDDVPATKIKQRNADQSPRSVLESHALCDARHSDKKKTTSDQCLLFSPRASWKTESQNVGRGIVAAINTDEQENVVVNSGCGQEVSDVSLSSPRCQQIPFAPTSSQLGEQTTAALIARMTARMMYGHYLTDEVGCVFLDDNDDDDEEAHEPLSNGIPILGARTNPISWTVESPVSNLRYGSPFSISPDFLEACFLCERPLCHGADTFMYRGDLAFCSPECRYQQILTDERDNGCSRSDHSVAAEPRRRAVSDLSLAC